MDGKDAFEKYINFYKDYESNYDVVFTDITMPNMNGHEATRQIRKFNKDVTIIAQTAYALEGEKEKAIEAGCDDYISKPIDKDELLEKIGRYCWIVKLLIV